MPDWYLVTGGGGFIGSHLVRALLERGANVRVLDDFSTGRRENISAVIDDIDLHEGSITDQETVYAAMQGIDYVLHQAAIPSVSRSIEDPLQCHETNTTGTLNVLLAARDAGVQKVVYAASSSAYGDKTPLPCQETATAHPLSPYAVAKLTGEHYCQAFHEVYNTPTVALRYFNVFGPRQDPNSLYSAVIPKFISLMLQGQAPTIHGDGLQSRDFTYIDNVVQANLLACKADAAAHGQVMNIACGQTYTLLDLVDRINTILGTRIQPILGPARPGDARHSHADISRAASLINYTPLISFDQGLRSTIDSFAGAPVQ